MASTVMDRDSLYGKLDEDLRTSRGQMINFHFLDRYLSLVRNQSGGQCGYVATITCMEMVHRILGIEVTEWSGKYYFNIDDIFNSLYDRYPNLPRALEKKADRAGLDGTRIPHILEFIKEYGLKACTECYNPRFRDYLSGFDEEVKRHQISSYKRLRTLDEVVSCVNQFPVIAVIRSCQSFKDCKSILYHGPNNMDRGSPRYFRKCHCVVIVGSVMIKLQSGWEQYLILQNSHGLTFGFNGFLVIKYVKDFFS